MRTLKLLFGLLVVVAAFYVAWQVGPPYFYAYQFQDFIENEARLDSYTTRSEQDIRETVYKKVQELEIPLAQEQINVQRSFDKGVAIWADYTVHVDLPGYPLDLKFHPATRNKPI